MPVSVDASIAPLDPDEDVPDDPEDDPDELPPEDDPVDPDDELVAWISAGFVSCPSLVPRSPASAVHPATARPDTKARRPHHPMITA